MSWSEQVFRYCERGQDPSLWAEPFNALSNLGFLAVASVLAVAMRRLPSKTPAADRAVLAALIALVAAIGVGSFLFHTFATRWSRLADVVPIGVFMAVYLAFALRVFLEASWQATGLVIAAFAVATGLASSLACPRALVGVIDIAREPCLKGTMGYAPALLALVVTGTLLHRRHAAASRLLLAAALFVCAMLLRWLDRDLCAMTALLGRVRGTHALWHLLNAATLYVLLAAAMDAVAAPMRKLRS